MVQECVAKESGEQKVENYSTLSQLPYVNITPTVVLIARELGMEMEFGYEGHWTGYSRMDEAGMILGFRQLVGLRSRDER